MKLLLVLYFSIFATDAMSCTDFSGNYKDSAGVLTSITQVRCSSITIIAADRVKMIVADGLERVVDQDDEAITKAVTSFIGDLLYSYGVYEYKASIPAVVAVEFIPVKVIITYKKSANGDLVISKNPFNLNGIMLDASALVLTKI